MMLHPSLKKLIGPIFAKFDLMAYLRDVIEGTNGKVD